MTSTTLESHPMTQTPAFASSADDQARDLAVTTKRAELHAAAESLRTALDAYSKASEEMLLAECAVTYDWRRTLCDFASGNKAEAGGGPESLRNVTEQILRKTCLRLLQRNSF